MPEHEARYSATETRAWLAWLARRMLRNQSTVFLIERLQPHWLARPRQRIWYLALYAPVMGLLLGGILQQSWAMGKYLDPPCPGEPVIALWIWWAVTTAWVFAVAGVDELQPRWITPASEDRRVVTILKTLGRMGFLFVTWMLPWLAIRYLMGDGYAGWAGLDPQPAGCLVGQFQHLGLAHPATGGAMLVLIYGSRVRGQAGVRPVEALGWSWRTAVRGILLGALAGLVTWGMYAVSRYGHFEFSEVARNLFLYPPLAATGGFLLGGLSIRVVREKTAPNQGMRLSLRNGLMAAALFGPVLALATWPVLIVSLEPIVGAVIHDTAPIGGLWFGGIAAIVALLWFGGRDVVMHVALRTVLWLTRQAPGDFVRFLDHGVAIGFLRKVGGGYMFIHRHLLEHFATLPDAPPQRCRTPSDTRS